MLHKFAYAVYSFTVARFIVTLLFIYYHLSLRVLKILWKSNLKKFLIIFFIRDLRICARNRIREYPRIWRAAAAGHDVNPALEDPCGGSNAFRFCVSSATRESSQGQVVPRFRASLRHSGRALKIDSNQFYT